MMLVIAVIGMIFSATFVITADRAAWGRNKNVETVTVPVEDSPLDRQLHRM